MGLSVGIASTKMMFFVEWASFCIGLTSIVRTNIQRYAEEYVAAHYQPECWRNFKYIDTLILAKKLDCIPTKKYSLKAICEYYDITPGNHRADGDTDSLIQCYKELLKELSNKLVLDPEWLYDNPYIVHEYIYG